MIRESQRKLPFVFYVTLHCSGGEIVVWPRIEYGDFQISHDGEYFRPVARFPEITGSGRLLQFSLTEHEMDASIITFRGHSQHGSWEDFIETITT